MKNKNISLAEAKRFHGHLGPYLVLGLLAGELVIKRLRCKKYFGLDIKVWGVNKKPKSCLVDGLQLATGATYGKGNIHKFNGREVKISVCNLENNRNIKLSLKEGLINRLNKLRGHKDSELFARKLYNLNPLTLLKLITHNS